MYAYAPNGTRIVSTKEISGGASGFVHGTLKLLPRNDCDADFDGGTEYFEDQQQHVVENGELMFVDADGEDWPACALVLLEHDLDQAEEEELPADLVTAAETRLEAWQKSKDAAAAARRYVIDMPEGGWRDRSSFSPEEKRLLRPIAETIAMLDGGAFFGMQVDAQGDDVHYEQYLPEAHALAEANGGWTALASFQRGSEPLPSDPMGLLAPREIGGRQVVDLADEPAVVLELSGIDWDTSPDDEEIPDGMTPHLPADLLVGVPSDWSEPGRVADLLSDRYGFCVNGIATVEPLPQAS